MKTLLQVLVFALAIASPLFADTVILQEDFEGALPGTTVDGYNGWSGFDPIVISGTALDSGQSADWSGGSDSWATRVTKGFTHTPVAGEIYTLTATLLSPQSSVTDAELHIRSSADPENQMQGVSICYGDMQFGVMNSSNVIKITPQPTTATDVKFVLQGDSSDFYYKAHGDSTWISAGGFTSLGWSISAYDQITISGHGGYAGGIDSILLTANVPEPSAVCLLVMGAFGMLAYAWRKRK